MSIGLNLQQKLSQKLAMTPQMQQSIQLLQLTTMELEQLAQQEMLENPFLEMDSENVEEETEGKDSAEIPEDKEYSVVNEEAEPDQTPLDRFNNMDVDWQNIFDSGQQTKTYTHDPDEEETDFTQYTAKPVSLNDDLIKQLHLTNLTGIDFEIGKCIIGSLNHDGYLVTPIEDIAEINKVSVNQVENVLKVVQLFEPTGIAARNLQECLLIQVEDKEIKNPVVIEILTNHFNDFKKKMINKIAKDMGISDEVVLKAFDIISKLEPKPGRTKTSDEAFYITPDVVVKKMNENYMCIINDGGISRLRINSYYKKVLLNENAHSQKEKEYALEKYKAAVWLIRNIEKRKSTILRVTEQIVKHQKLFFDKGMGFLKPLVLREIAEELNLHESTIARVTSGKYMETPRGTFELKYFFSSGLNTDSGDDTSSTNIKETIKEIVSNENPKKPLSDEIISKMLNEKGIQIARRTVAKYREQIKILPAKLRKTF